MKSLDSRTKGVHSQRRFQPRLERLEERTTPTAGLGWARSFGGTESEHARAVAVNNFGHTFLVGNFAGTADFDPGPGTANLTSPGDFASYVVKLDSLGNFAWAKAFGGPDGGTGANDVAIDGAGNLYVTGFLFGAADFDPGPALSILESDGGGDAYVVKLDAAGNFVWARSFGGLDNDSGQHVAVDDTGNVYVAGEFQGTADFDPGPLTEELTSAGRSDVYVMKLSATGHFHWAGSLGGSGSLDGVGDIALGQAGSIYVTGTFEGTGDFDPGPGTYELTSVGRSDAYAMRLDNEGRLDWARSFGGSKTELGFGLALDRAENVYLTGVFEGTADFDPGPGTHQLTAGGLGNAYAVKLNSAGEFAWARSFGGPNYDSATEVVTDRAGNVYLAGAFQGTADFDPGPGTYNLTSAGTFAAFALKLTPAGNLAWAKPFGGFGGGPHIDALVVSRAGNLYLAGDHDDTVDFDPGPGTFNLTSAGGSDAFLVRMTDRPDLLGRSATGRWWLASNDRTGFTSRQVGRWAEGRQWKFPLRADFNGDGREDVLARAANGDWWLAAPTLSGQLAFRLWSRWNPTGLSNVVTGDFNGDFRPDIAGMDGTGDWIVGLNTGRGFAHETWGMWDDSVPWKLARAADCNGDGLTDLVGLDNNGEWWVSLNTGDGAFTNEPWGVWDPTLNFVDIQVADFNNDGSADIAGRDRNGAWQVGIANPDLHQFLFKTWATWEPVAWKDVRVGDFNGDGRLDLVGRHPTTGAWQVGLNNGGAFQTSTGWATWAGTWSDVSIGDFDGDGRDDIVGRNAAGTWQVARSTGSAFTNEIWGAWGAGPWKDVRAGGFRA